ncbi:pyrroline-5-carboxylate reductase [Hydromonas duriensis]|uniref:Pyrroline-5-carboxylate reductase n=1 Tax=Hydromonas duriensis TaxID=1527608 RepID=A0A4R6YBZ0_9BURK|nr:pyrroline-5-carboxylate reductase [Hydromonas duriensis]TDR33124.1 pyrroline-5-carboxylate reductase [Hydromonas duriensis]
MHPTSHIAFIGGGNMATAIITGMIKQGGFAPEQISVIENNTEKAQHLQRHLGVHAFADIKDVSHTADVWVLAVKPQSMKEALTSLTPHLTPDQIVLSIAAGLTIATLSEWLNGHHKVVRTMPNTPALVGQGVTGIYAPLSIVSENEQVLINQILAAIGTNVWLSDEKSIDAITAISGSGPAYVFYVMEHLTAAARCLGFNDETAKQLVQATFAGAVALVEASEEPVSILRERVTSKGGTTAAALNVFNERGMNQTLIDGANAAAHRAEELAIELSKG